MKSHSVNTSTAPPSHSVGLTTSNVTRRKISRLWAGIVILAAIGGAGFPATAQAAVNIGLLPAGGTLYAGDAIVSPNGAYRLVMQTDGNLVEYGPRGAIWATYTSGATRFVNQTDGNEVLYGATGAVWASGTNGRGPAHLIVQDDGNAVAYSDTSAAAVWTTYTNGGVNRMASMAALAYARSKLGKPYVYGATGPNSFDCSGLTQAAYASAGVGLLRTSQQQFTQGTGIAQNALIPGDLIFYRGQGTSPNTVQLSA